MNILAAVYVYLFLFSSLPDKEILFYWLGLVTVVNFLRLWCMTYLPKHQSAPTLKRIYGCFVLITFINGVLWGSLYPMFFHQMDDLQRLLITMIVLGGTTVAIISLGSSKLIYYAFVLPSTLPIIYINTMYYHDLNYYFFNVGLIIYLLLTFYLYHHHYAGMMSNFQLLTRQKSLIENLKITNEKLRKASTTDSLTGLHNRRYFSNRLAKDWKRCKRTSLPIALLIIDIDYFKEYNDAYGHLRGDMCLQAIANVLKKEVMRTTDLAARFGGDELAVILYDTKEEDAVKKARKIMDEVHNLAIHHSKSPKEIVTISIGIAVKIPTIHEQDESLVAEADRALYTVKEVGRDNLSIYQP